MLFLLTDLRLHPTRRSASCERAQTGILTTFLCEELIWTPFKVERDYINLSTIIPAPTGPSSAHPSSTLRQVSCHQPNALPLEPISAAALTGALRQPLGMWDPLPGQNHIFSSLCQCQLGGVNARESRPGAAADWLCY